MLSQESLKKQLGAAQATPRRVVGLKPLPGGAQTMGVDGKPIQSPVLTSPDQYTNFAKKDNAFSLTLDLENQAVMRALQGKEPLDPTLLTQFDEKERLLREKLQRQLGPDYETSTAGSYALNDLARQRSEALTEYNRNIVAVYAPLADARAKTLSGLAGERMAIEAFPSELAFKQAAEASDLTTARLKNLAFPAANQVAQAGALGDISTRISQFLGVRNQGRGAQATANQNKYELDQAAQARQTAAITGALQSIAGGAYGLGTSGLFNPASSPTSTNPAAGAGAGGSTIPSSSTFDPNGPQFQG
jgi:hypothetical protein